MATLKTRAERMHLRLDHVGHAVHEIRRPLAAVRAFGDILHDELSGPLNGEQKAHLGVLLANAERLGGLIDEVYELAEVASGGLLLQLAPCDLAELAAGLRDELERAFREREVELVLACEGPVVHDEIDAVRFGRALRRLLGNALRCSPKGGRVTLQLAQDGRTIRIVVTDDGPLLPTRAVEGVFRLFAASAPDAPRPEDGIGAGLFLCRSLVQALGGEVWAENRRGRGMRFLIELPCGPRGRGSAQEPGDAEIGQHAGGPRT